MINDNTHAPATGRVGGHRVQAAGIAAVCHGTVHYAPVRSMWFTMMLIGAVVGGVATATPSAVALFGISTGIVLLFGHSLGSHRKLIHNSYQCPRWLAYLFVYCGTMVGLSGPIALLRQHELRDYAQRLPRCHHYLRHGSGFWRDAWWQLHCELHLDAPPEIHIEAAVANDEFYSFLERTWMLQQLPWALAFFAWGGWSFVFWGVCARVTAGVLGHWLIGYFAHNHGEMHYRVSGAAVQGRNIRWTSLLTMGECWHNNHHAYPGSAKLGLFDGEWDPGWWVLVALRKVGLVWNLRLPEDLPPRAELMPLDLPVSRQFSNKLRRRMQPLPLGAARKLRVAFLATEAIACFALPAYIWLWGVITTPLWYFAAARVGSFPFLDVGYIVGGGLGLGALIAFVRYLSRQDADAPFALTRNVVFASAGLLSAWGYVTTDFEYFDVNGFVALAAGLPSLCFAHMIFLCLEKIRSRNSSRAG